MDQELEFPGCYEKQYWTPPLPMRDFTVQLEYPSLLFSRYIVFDYFVLPIPEAEGSEE